jgi:RNA polymerase sigma factor (sigma-70 family)
MDSVTDNELLRRFVDEGDEATFRLVVDRYVDLVYGSARRHSKDHHLSEEVTQRVFAILARKAARLVGHPNLGGWLLRTAYFEAAKAVLAESTRKRNIENWKVMNEPTDSSNDAEEIPPETVAALDDALQELSESDRELVILRYYRDASYREIGARFGISENAGQKRVVRLLERLGDHLKRRGVQITSSALGVVLVATLGKSAPLGMSATATAHAVASLGAASTMGQALPALLLGHLKVAAFIALGAAMLPVGYHLLAPPTGNVEHAGMPETGNGPGKTSQDVLAFDPLFGGTTDPAERMRRILALEDAAQRASEIQFLAMSLPMKDLPTALGILADREPEDTAHLKAFIESWGSRDAQAAMEFIESRPQPFVDDYWDALMKGWVSTKPEEAWNYVSALPADSHGEDRLNLWVREVSYLDGATAMARLASVPTRVRNHHFDQIFQNWPTGKLDEALDSIAGLKQQTWKELALGALTQSWSTIKQGLDFLEQVEASLGLEVRRSFEETFISKWFPGDPRVAIAAIRAIDDPEEQRRAAQSALTSGGYRDFAEQFQFIDDFGENKNRWVRDRVMDSWLVEDHKAAISYVESLPPERQAPFGQSLGVYYGQRFPEQGVEWSDHLKDPGARREFLTHLLRESAKHNFNAVLDLMDEVGDQDVIATAASDITEAYAKREPAEAMQWALEFGGADNRVEAVGRAMRHWARADLSEATAWFDDQEDSAIRDATAHEIARAALETGNPVDAFEWASKIESPGEKWKSMNSVAKTLVRNDASTFVRWF